MQVFWRATVAAARRNKGAWSSLSLGLSLGDCLGDILTKYGASLRERESSAVATATVVYGTCYVDMKSLSLVRYSWRMNTTCLELLLQLATRVYLLVLE